MRKLQAQPLLACLLAGVGLTAVCQPVMANDETDCRQEAEEYGIPPEQLEDYVDGCILSRGGDDSPEPVVEDYNAPEEGEVADDAGTDNSNVTQ